MMPTFLAPWWGLLGLLAIPIVALYILRQRRPDTPISSTLLWSKALADMRASTPWQRLRRNLLLLLQLLILAALVITLMRPVVQSQATTLTAGVIVIDATASMKTTDGGGPSRFDRAKEEVRKLINAMRSGDRFNIIADGGGIAQSSTGFSNSRAELLSFVENLKATDATSDLSESLLLAATSIRAIGGTTGDAARTEALTRGKIYLLSDGAGVNVPNVYRELQLQFVKIGESSNNAGITRLAISPVPKAPGTYEIFVGVLNASDQEREVAVGLALGKPENFTDARKVRLKAGTQGGVVFEKVVSSPGKFWVQLDDKNDDLAVDNVGFGLIERPRKVRVLLVTTGNRLLEDFLTTSARLGNLDGAPRSPKDYKPTEKADLVIFDDFVPKELPACDVFFVRPPTSVAGFKIIGTLERPAIFRWKRDHPLLDSVELGDVRVWKAARLERDPENIELISTTAGPLMAARDAGSSRRYILSFSPMMESNWWYETTSLLLMLDNMVSETRARHFIGTPQVLAAGTAARLFDITPESTVTVPDGSSRPLGKYVKERAAEFPETDQVGLYTVRSGEKTASFAVNTLSPAESNIAPRSLSVAAGGNVEEARSVAAVNREIWQWLAMAALAVLLVEWIVYHRRIA